MKIGGENAYQLQTIMVMLAKREMSKKQLREISGISTASLAKLGIGKI